jgi:hypothetical protein
MMNRNNIWFYLEFVKILPLLFLENVNTDLRKFGGKNPKKSELLQQNNHNISHKILWQNLEGKMPKNLMRSINGTVGAAAYCSNGEFKGQPTDFAIDKAGILGVHGVSYSPLLYAI